MGKDVIATIRAASFIQTDPCPGNTANSHLAHSTAICLPLGTYFPAVLLLHSSSACAYFVLPVLHCSCHAHTHCHLVSSRAWTPSSFCTWNFSSIRLSSFPLLVQGNTYPIRDLFWLPGSCFQPLLITINTLSHCRPKVTIQKGNKSSPLPIYSLAFSS